MMKTVRLQHHQVEQRKVMNNSDLFGDKIKMDTDKVIQKVYHTEELHKILTDITTQYINDVVLMSDTELNQDRSEWIKMYGKKEEEANDVKYHTSIHTIAIEIEQLRRFKDITYIDTKQITE